MSRYLARLRRWLDALFAERHVYVRSGGQMRSYVLTPARQMAAAGLVAGGALWLGVATVAMLFDSLALSAAHDEVARTEAKYERWIADRQARLNTAIARLDATDGSGLQVAEALERRHAALALLLTDMKDAPGAAQALGPVIQARTATDPDPLHRLQQVRASQERLLAAADEFARTKGERLRLAFRLAGMTPNAAQPKSGALGGPLIEAKDPRAPAAVLDVDEAFASRIQRVARALSDTRALSVAAAAAPFGRPTALAATSSGFGVRYDPFNGHPAFHSGLDFAGGLLTPVVATGPGVVSFTGQRSGYGNTIEIDHGGGLKTRYAHLQSIGVRVGQQVGVGQRIGAMGSTGRSTGPHLHYEVWINGRAQNPDRFLRAGRYVLENS